MTFSGTVEIPYDYKIVRYIGGDETLVLHQIQGKPSFKRNEDTLITTAQFLSLAPYMELFTEAAEDSETKKRGRPAK